MEAFLQPRGPGQRVDRVALESVYERFLALHRPLLRLAARWQTDEDRFELVFDLVDLVERAVPVISRTAELLERFAPYVERLQAAADALEAGDHRYAVAPQVDSVRTIWLQVHQDYLRALS